MNKQQFLALETLRERVEDRARKDLQEKCIAVIKPTEDAERARTELLNEQASRQAAADQWKKTGGAPTSAAEQLAGRACLGRMDTEVLRRLQVAAKAGEVLLKAVMARQESYDQLSAARMAKEKSQDSTKRFLAKRAQERLQAEEGELEEETELQVMSRFAQRVD